MASTGLLESFLSAVQASLSVLLVISYGGIAAYLNLLDSKTTKVISKICVRMFLPALLIVQIGSQLHAGAANRYLLILVWAIICHVISFLIGIFAHIFLGMPDWTTAAIMFNNTTSYPLLLIAALQDTGVLQALIISDETTREAVERAKSYFLVFATISSCLTFAVGPRLIDSEHASDPTTPPSDDTASEASGDHDEANENTSLLESRESLVSFSDPFKQTSFFPSLRKQSQTRVKILHDRRASVIPRKHWATLGPRAKWWLLFISDFFNAPLLGAAIGAVIGLIPALHRAFFASSYDGGIFTAWLTSSLRNIGGLFVPLPVVVAGVSLFNSWRESRSSGSSQHIPWLTVIFILVVRFVIWPIASILAIYALASKTNILGSDPMLWFAMMLMPTGPPAMKLITLVQVSDASEEDEKTIAELLTISYIISPILSFTVVGSLRAAELAV